MLAVFVVAIAAILGLAPAAVAQAPATQPAAGGAQSAAPATPAAPAPPAAPEGHTYRPEGRRDPFISLLRRGSDSGSSTPVARGQGLKGLGAGEVTLRGTLASQGGYVAILQGADSKTYIVRPGEQLADGTIRSITADALVILQKVDDPLSLEKQREVRKVLRQTEEGRQ
jgi:Tfp pilus assembly protein PilP